MAKHEGELSFSNKEADALRQIVADWLHEAIVTPPYPAEIEAVLKKLDLAAPEHERSQH